MKFSFHIFNQKKIIVPLFFSLWMLIGIVAHNDYGLSMDESIERTTGLVSTKYLANSIPLKPLIDDPVISQKEIPDLHDYADKSFGPFFAIVSILLERIFNIGNGIDERKIYEFRHLLTFLFSFFGGVAIYQLAARRFKNWGIGLLAVLLLITSPRFFAESFYNNKDLVFLSLFALAANASIRFTLNVNKLNAFWAALFTAAAIDTRIAAIFLVGLTFLGISLRLQQRELCFKNIIPPLLLYFLASAALVVLFWPLLWESPIANFLNTLGGFSRWVRSSLTILFMGKEISSTAVPWEYIPTYILITTPPPIILCFLIGAYLILKSLSTTARKKGRLFLNSDQIQDLIFCAIVFIPILSAIALNSVVYDGWRHLYFIYPFILLVSILGITHFYQQVNIASKLMRSGFFICISLFIAHNILWIKNAHPYQYSYFNLFAGKNWVSKFDVDYWGLSNKNALHYVLNRDSRELIKIYPDSFITLTDTLRIFSQQDQKRILVVDNLHDADYIFTNYRQNGKTSTLPDAQKEFLKIFDVVVDDEIIYSVFKKQILINMPPVTTNKKINFSRIAIVEAAHKNIKEPHLSATGWSEPEEWGVWSNEEHATLQIPISDVNNLHSILLTGKAFITPHTPEQIIQIYLDKKFVASQTLTLANRNVIKIPIENLPKNTKTVNIDLHFPNRISPKSINMGPDERQLAFGLESISFQ
ncbi:glycosyltransferase family 39 protein [Polynucleobacter sp. 15G-AUS-farblos]|uniref:ArnT family glycosyltransferase n=1 Tax=Polynucleobacter sp. 15G-AUS-farblos TaxID=2689094 RepID=UPI001C0CAB16|nr:glycosyltransferase family 39 protein [Polynucleobacter sp. 15G-AUS-farblos]MBU3584104.1 glycosyltransferase family 39 protein [Polynucleobacter sp. 15G-AUS-farblos]